MEHLDEKIIELMNEMQSQQGMDSGTKSTSEEDTQPYVHQLFIKLDDEIIPFAEQKVLEDKISLSLPKTFTVMSPEMAALKYPMERRPKLIYTNELGTINLAFNHTDNLLEEKEMAEFTKSMVNILVQTQASAQVLGEGIREVNGRKIGYCEFVTQALDGKIYNLFFFAALEGRALFCTFNCLEEEMEDWQPIAKGMMDSLHIYSEEEGGASV